MGRTKEIKSYRIVVIPGDGIGPEIVDAALAVLDKLQELAGDLLLSYDFRQAGAAYYREHGENISAEALEAIRQSDATLKGPVGLTEVRRPDGSYIRFDDNAVVILETEKEPKGGRILGPIPKEIKENDSSVLLIEQNAKSALRIADRGYIMVMGKNVFEGKPDEILDHNEIGRLYLGRKESKILNTRM